MKPFVLAFSWLAVAATAATTTHAEERRLCRDSLSVIERDFEDIHGKIAPDALTQLQLIRQCVRRSPYCAVGEGDPNGGYTLVEADSISDTAFSKSKMAVAAAVAIVDNKQHGRVCALVRFSGGSASAWAVSAWYAGPRREVVPLSTDQVSIRGEGFTPIGILRTVSKSLYGVR